MGVLSIGIPNSLERIDLPVSEISLSLGVYGGKLKATVPINKYIIKILYVLAGIGYISTSDQERIMGVYYRPQFDIKIRFNDCNLVFYKCLFTGELDLRDIVLNNIDYLELEIEISSSF